MKYDALIDSCARSRCPIANSLDIFGDKWSLLIVRDLLLLGKGQYQDFTKAPEGIATNILADRLKKMEAAGIVKKHAYQQKPVRYEYSLTAKGQDLKPVLLALVSWGGKHIEGAFAPNADKMKNFERQRIKA